MPGTVLLLAASPVGKGCLVDATSVLPVLAAVPPSVLSGTDTANVVELADPLEPQAVLTRLRAAAAAPGPLTLFIVGQLQLDRRQRLPHLALARTTPATVRYTAFPWHWFREELRLRAPGSTTVLLDLHADADAWEWLRDNPLDCGLHVTVYGRVVPPGGRRSTGTPSYMKAVGTILRSGGRPSTDQLHWAALTRVRGEGENTDLVVEPGTGWGAGGGGSTGGMGVVGAAVVGGPARGRGTTGRAGAEDLSTTGMTDRRPAEPASGAASGTSGAAGTTGTTPATSAPSTPSPTPIPTPTPTFVVPPLPKTAPVVPAQPADDPHAAITAAVQSGRHREAEGIAARWQETAVETYGAGSDEALHWAEVRADLAMFAGDAERSCRTWLAVAALRLAAGQPVDAPEVEAAVDRAHHQWGRIDTLPPARELAPTLMDLRTRVPGRREGALDHIQQQLRHLENAETPANAGNAQAEARATAPAAR